MDAVRCYIKSRDDWDVHLPQIAGALTLRCAVNRQTGFTANKLMLGREVSIRADLLYRPPPCGNIRNAEEYGTAGGGNSQG